MKKSNTAVCFCCDEQKTDTQVTSWGGQLHIVCKSCRDTAK